jgi:hypothetical protein
MAKVFPKYSSRRNVRPLEWPVQAKGRLELWTRDAGLLAQIREQVPA